MPWRLQRFQEARCLHFITFSCQHRDPLLADPAARDIFVDIFERTRRWYGFFVCGFVVMPEHVHLLISEPERSRLAVALQMLKQNTARKLRTVEGTPFWEPRYYDFNVWSEAKRIEKLRYIHRNPVRRGLVERPEDWAWSSFRHYATGADCVVEIESQWTERRRERNGTTPRITKSPNSGDQSPESQIPHPVSAKTAETRMGHPMSRNR